MTYARSSTTRWCGASWWAGGTIRVGVLHRLISDEQVGREHHAKQIWQLLTLEPWYRNMRSLGVAR
jgi:hypothetical protein